MLPFGLNPKFANATLDRGVGRHCLVLTNFFCLGPDDPGTRQRSGELLVTRGFMIRNIGEQTAESESQLPRTCG